MARERIEDLGDLVKTATDALITALKDGGIKHPTGSWKNELTGDQFNHIHMHFRALQNNGIEEEGEDHLSHLICRAVMAKAIHGAIKK